MEPTPDSPARMAKRKNDHIEICLHQDVESRARTFDDVELIPEALPECDLADISTKAVFLGREFALPLLITGMTGGVQQGMFINRVLVRAAARSGIPMGLGSQKMMIVDTRFTELFDVKAVAPEAFVLGNIGLAARNYGVSLAQIERVIIDLKLDAFAFHLNALQEAIQPEGETNFSNLLRYLDEAVKRLPVPVLVKEVGSGLSGSTARRLAETGVQAIDVGGKSGTSWGLIEGKRGTQQDDRLGELFRNWGLSTLDSLLATKSALGFLDAHPKGVPALVATGGIRNGLQVAKAIGLGAQMAGVGLPFFRAVMRGQGDEEFALQELLDEVLFFERSLRIAMFASGARELHDLPARIVRSTCGE